MVKCVGSVRLNFSRVYFWRRKTELGSFEFGISSAAETEPVFWFRSKRSAIKAFIHENEREEK
jgi:hypothetical protein